MDEPSPRTSRLMITGGIVAVMLVGGGGFLIGRDTVERETASVAPVPAVRPAPSPSPTPSDATNRVLNRADLIAIARMAADAKAAGGAIPPEVLKANGRQFEIRLPFGCAGPADVDSNASMRWRYDTRDGALRLHVAPVVWTKQDWWLADGPADVEAIEGFWISRPWTSSEACPATTSQTAATGPEPVTLPGQTLAIAQFFGPEGARRGRREGQSYDTVVRIAPDELNDSQGFHLRLSGRIRNIAGDGPMLCSQPAGPEQQPICAIGVAMDEVAIRNPTTGQTLATWAINQKDAQN